VAARATATEKRQFLRAPARRAQLLEAAERLVEDEGVAALTMERLADRAGVSKPVVYYHFDNRSDVLRALLETYWDEVDREHDARTASATDFATYLRAATAAYFDTIARHGPAMRALLDEPLGDDHVEALRTKRHDGIRAAWSAALRRRSGISRARADAAAAIALAALQAACRHWFTTGAARSAVEETYVEIVLAGAAHLSRDGWPEHLRSVH